MVEKINYLKNQIIEKAKNRILSGPWKNETVSALKWAVEEKNIQFEHIVVNTWNSNYVKPKKFYDVWQKKG